MTTDFDVSLIVRFLSPLSQSLRKDKHRQVREPLTSVCRKITSFP